MKRLAVVVFLALLASGIAATPAAAAPGPPDHPEWWFDTWNVQGLWASGARGQGITIGEIDTGINAGLPELAANVLPGTDFGDLGGNGQTDRDTDDFGHGTAMASLMVAHDGQDNILGMAPDAHVLPIAVPITGTTDDAGDQAGQLLLQAIHWAADHGAKIISMSLGSQRSPEDIGRSCPATEQSAVDYALSKGAIVVASGGNAGDKGSPIEDPGVCLGVVSVGAVDSADTVPVWSSKHPYLTVAAPGVDVPSISKIPGEAFFGDGTSQAAALTSAGLAVIWSKYPQLTNRQVVARLLATLDSKHTTRDTAVGYGVIHIGAAVTANVAPAAPNPVYDGVAPFLAQDTAVAKLAPDPKVKPATTRKGFPGSFAVAPAPSPLTSGAGLGGIVAGGVGLIAVVFLTVGAARRRRLASPWGYVVDPPTEPIPVITFGPGSPSPVDTPEPAARPVESNWQAVAPIDAPEPTASPADKPSLTAPMVDTPSSAGLAVDTPRPAAPTVDTPGSAQPLTGESSAQPAIGANSPTDPETTAGESAQDHASGQPAADSPSGPGVIAAESARDATTQPDALAQPNAPARPDAAAQPEAPTRPDAAGMAHAQGRAEGDAAFIR